MKEHKNAMFHVHSKGIVIIKVDELAYSSFHTKASLFLIIDGIIYSVFAPLWGLLLDKKLDNRYLSTFSYFNLTILLIGSNIVYYVLIIF